MYQGYLTHHIIHNRTCNTKNNRFEQGPTAKPRKPKAENFFLFFFSSISEEEDEVLAKNIVPCLKNSGGCRTIPHLPDNTPGALKALH